MAVAAAAAQDPTKDYTGITSSLEVPLDVIIECLNVFGTAGTANTIIPKDPAKSRKYKKPGQAGDGGEENERGRGGSARGGSVGKFGNNRLDEFFGVKDGTGLRISYAGAGYPLVLLM